MELSKPPPIVVTAIPLSLPYWYGSDGMAGYQTIRTIRTIAAFCASSLCGPVGLLLS